MQLWVRRTKALSTSSLRQNFSLTGNFQNKPPNTFLIGLLERIMELPRLDTLSNEALAVNIKVLRRNESLAVADVVLHLHEIDRRGIWRDWGYASLFSYCTQDLGYSEGGAHRRCTAARLLSTNPEIYQHLKEQRISLCA